MSTDLWGLDPWTLLAIALMGLTTFLSRAGGYWLFRQISPSPLVRAILHYIPGTLFLSFVVPGLVHGGFQSILGALAAALTMIYVRNMGLAIAAGVIASYGVWIFR